MPAATRATSAAAVGAHCYVRSADEQRDGCRHFQNVLHKNLPRDLEFDGRLLLTRRASWANLVQDPMPEITPHAHAKEDNAQTEPDFDQSHHRNPSSRICDKASEARLSTRKPGSSGFRKEDTA